MPFRISATKTNIAAVLPPRRSTLVAPGLSEPWVRGSGRWYSFEINTALEIDPNR